MKRLCFLLITHFLFDYWIGVARAQVLMLLVNLLSQLCQVKAAWGIEFSFLLRLAVVKDTVSLDCAIELCSVVFPLLGSLWLELPT